MNSKKIHIPDLDDYTGTLEDLADYIDRLIQYYGKYAEIRFDAGANNIEVFIER